MIQSRGEKIFGAINVALLTLLSISMLAPLLHVLAKSISNEAAVMAGDVILWPIGFTLETYRVVLGTHDFWQSFQVSVFITTVGTMLHVLVMSMAAYPLSRPYLWGNRVLTFLFVFTMMFSGGLIPTYLVVRSLGLIDKVWALILPGLVSTFNLIILRNFFASLPDALEESAKLDGASNLAIFFRIFFPLSMPAVATVCVYTAVGFWNAYFGALIYINRKSLFPLSLYLRKIVLEMDTQLVNLNPEMANLNPESVRSATIFAATLPILLVYPFLQRYFVKGVILGAVKG